MSLAELRAIADANPSIGGIRNQLEKLAPTLPGRVHSDIAHALVADYCDRRGGITDTDLDADPVVEFGEEAGIWLIANGWLERDAE